MSYEEGRLKDLLSSMLLAATSACAAAARRLRGHYWRLVLGSYGKGTVICENVRIGNPQNVHCASNVIVGDHAVLQACNDASIYLGNWVHLSYGACILTGGLELDSGVPRRDHVSASVRVDDYVWVGCRAIILPGVHVGQGAVIAAGAVVTCDVKAFSLVAGIPARLVRQLSDDGVSKSVDCLSRKL